MHAQRIPATAERLTTAHACLGRAIQEFRIARGISEGDLGLAAHANRAYVVALEQGRINPPFHTLVALIHGLGVTLEELIIRHQRHIETYPGRPQAGVGA